MPQCVVEKGTKPNTMRPTLAVTAPRMIMMKW